MKQYRDPLVVFARDSVVATQWMNGTISVWRGKPTPETADLIGQLYGQLYRDYPDGYAVMLIVEDTFALPDESTRKKVTDLLNRWSSRMKRQAIVHEGSGFLAAALRAMYVVMETVVRTKFPWKIFSSVDASLAWMAEEFRDKDGRPVSPADLRRAVEFTRAQWPVS
jgi:hypothetical protein